MKALICSLLCFLFSINGMAQNYFPPIAGDDWETLPIDSLNWCADRVDSLVQYLDDSNSKSFLILKGGKIVLEHYFDSYTQDSVWYWASSGKSLTSVLVGCAQEDGLLSIEDPTSDYLGLGWTSAPADKEALITIENQITMTTGLNDLVLDQECVDPSCLAYLEDSGDRWAYYNAPYRLVLDVLANASGTGINLYTYQRLGSQIGMGGVWLDYVRFSTARDMARFGLLVLNDGVWDGNPVLSDSQYLADMRAQSQSFNEAYGYLWWLNGTSSFMAPLSQLVFPGSLTPEGPSDMYAALGLNDQKIYIVPSMDMVVIRQGEAVGQALLGPSSFDSDLWAQIMDLECEPDYVTESVHFPFKIYPNPVHDHLQISGASTSACYRIIDLQGRSVMAQCDVARMDVSQLQSGTYFLQVEAEGQFWTRPFIRD